MNKKLLLYSLLSASLICSLLVPIGPLAPLGKLLNPYSGIWINTHNDFENLPKTFHLQLKKPVNLEFEESGIPHISAENDEDLYFTQGYLEARDRLWEMDFMSRVAGGRVSEILGKKTLALDESFVQLRIPEAAQASLEMMMKDELTKLALENYAAGVNYFIEHLQTQDLPLEFKLFNYLPEKWTPLKSELLIKFMAFSLSGHSNDLPITRNRKLFSKADFESLFPIHYNYEESIISKDHKWISKTRLPPLPGSEFIASLLNQKLAVEPHPGNGSNNWAVFGDKSSTHLPILSNDIHLDYSLPALWYQMQLVSPSQNVYGVSLIGAPGIVIGFSKELAWGVTNASGDFMDWYEMKFKDETKSSYFFDGEWRPVREHNYTIKVRGAEALKLKLKDTHFGPIVFDNDAHEGLKNIPKGLALRWTALDPSNELKSFLQLNRARSLSDCQNALSGFESPAQNFICADQTGQVEMIERGKFPLRFKGQGQLVSDGSDSTYQWSKNIPNEEMAMEINPKRNFVFSANQQPTASSYPLYLGTYYESPFRAQRIHQVLSEKEIFTPEEIVKMQTDTLNKLGEKVVPNLILALARIEKSKDQEQAFDQLKAWDFHNDLESIGATVFDHLWSNLEKNIWSRHFPDEVNYRYPNSFMTSELIIHDPKSKWLNPSGESFEQILAKSFKQSVDEIVIRHASNPENWKWKFESRAVLNHITKIPFFSTDIESPGDRFNIMANRTNHGPVWKMVVSLGENFKAFGIYPGGQSGDIRSPHAREFLSDWASSHLRPLQYLSRDDFKKSSTNILEPLQEKK